MATTKLYPPQFYGGAEMSTHSLSLLLREAGHEVAVLSGLARKGKLTLHNRLKRATRLAGHFPVDRVMGYPVHRGWQPCEAVDDVTRKFDPDVIVAQSGEVMAIAEAFASKPKPVFIFLRHTHYGSLGGRPRKTRQFSYVANSQHTAARYKADFDLDCHVMPPTVIAELYRTETDRSRVVYINPNPMKGVDLVLELARLRPDIPFDIVESWTLPEQMIANRKRVAATLPNVRWLRATADMRQIYRHARILLAPSGVGHPEWVEAWGRVATEAQFSGIPVLASNSGGLPESVGPGGIIVDTNAPIDDWLAALSVLWDDQRVYTELSAAANAYSRREDIQPDQTINGFVGLMKKKLATHSTL